MRKSSFLTVISVFLCMLFFSCGKEYVEEITKNIEPVVVDKAFRVDSISVSDLTIGLEQISFVAKVHGNPMNRVVLDVLVNGSQTGYAVEHGKIVVGGLAPNTLYELIVRAILPTDGNHREVKPFSATFLTPNNLGNNDFFFFHRDFYYPLDHLRALDGNFVFLSWGDHSVWRNDGPDPLSPYKYKANFDLIKADASGNVLYRMELPDIGTSNPDDRKGWLKEFSNGDLLIISDTEVRRYNSGGQFIWSYSAKESSSYNLIADVEIMSDGSLYLVGRRIERDLERAQITLLSSDGRVLKSVQYSNIAGQVQNFAGVASFGGNVLYVCGFNGENTKLIRLVNLEVDWIKDIVYEDYGNFYAHKMKLEASSDDQLYFSAFLVGYRTSHVIAAKLNLEGDIIAGRVIDDLDFGDVAFADNGRVFMTGSPLWGDISSFTRLVSLNSDFSVDKDFYFQTRYGLTAGASILALPNDGASIFGLAVGTQWHSIF